MTLKYDLQGPYMATEHIVLTLQLNTSKLIKGSVNVWPILSTAYLWVVCRVETGTEVHTRGRNKSILTFFFL